MKAIFMGTPDIAVPSLDALIEEQIEVVAVFTQPDKPKGRGKKLAFSAVKERALDLNLDIYQPIKIKDLEYINLIRDLKPDIIIVTAFGQILPKDILDIPKYGCINVHASLLPKYRGAAPINWAIINGEIKTGITTMYMDTGLDTGDMILKSELDIESSDTSEDLYNKMKPITKTILKDTIKLLLNNSAPRIKQDDLESTYAPIMSKELGLINWNETVSNIINLSRGVYPWPGAYTKYVGETMKIKELKKDTNDLIGRPGEILEIINDGIKVQAIDGTLLIGMIQMPGKKMIKVEDYIKGNKIEKGIVLGN